MKGQVVANFIFDHEIVEVTQDYVGLKPWRFYFDGSKHKNGIGIGILIISLQEIPTKLKFKIKGFCYNNEAECEALISCIKILLNLGAKGVEIKGDSELVMKQLTKEYKCIK